MIDFRQQAIAGVQLLQPYQPGKPVEELERELGISHIIKLASNENPLGASPKAIQALQLGLQELAIYPDGSAYHLKQAIATQLQVQTQQITIGNGSNDILEIIARAYLDHTRGAVFSEHAFAIYPIVTQAIGAQLQMAKANPASHASMPYGSNLTNLLAAIQANTQIIFLANPNNPTGTWVEKAALYSFLQQVPTHIIVVIDEAYIEYSVDSDFPNALLWLDEFPNLIVTRTFSKIYGLAALRVGYAISSPDIADILNRVRQPFNVNSLALLAATAALGDHEHIQRSIEVNQAGLQQWQAACEQYAWVAIPSAGNFITIDFQQTGEHLFERLLHEGIIVRPVTGYGLPTHLRITIGTPAQNQRAIAALVKVLQL